MSKDFSAVGDKINTDTSKPTYSFSAGKSIFSIIFILLLIIAFLGVLRGREFPYSFTQLLNDFSNAPTIDISNWHLDDLQINGDWGIFDWFKDILNFSADVIVLLVFLCVGLIQLITYIFYFVNLIL